MTRGRCEWCAKECVFGRRINFLWGRAFPCRNPSFISRCSSSTFFNSCAFFRPSVQCRPCTCRFQADVTDFFFGILIVQVMSEYASIKDAFGIVSLSAAQEPPIFRGQVGEIHSARHKNMTQTIATSNPHPVGASSCGVPGAGHCVGAGSRELERCPAGVSCPACARVHPIEMSPSSHWSSVPRGTKIEILWLLIKDALESDLFLILSVLFVVYLLKF